MLLLPGHLKASFFCRLLTIPHLSHLNTMNHGKEFVILPH
jgi:hypothetical protein